MFRAAICPSSGEVLHQCNTRFMSLCVDDRLVCRLTCILDRQLCVKLVIYKDVNSYFEYRPKSVSCTLYSI